MTTHAGKVAVVTGAGRGIGQAIADAHAAAARASGWTALACTADVADFAAVVAACRAVERDLGPVDILVNNAGISPKTNGRKADAFEMDPAEWRRVLDVNLTGAFHCARAPLPGMKVRGYGRVVNVSSVAGRTYCDIVGVHYAATKAALIGFTKHLAGELGPFGITVNAVAPGRIDTPLGRLGAPRDVAATCLFFTSDAAGFVTAQVCDVAGGWLMT